MYLREVKLKYKINENPLLLKSFTDQNLNMTLQNKKIIIGEQKEEDIPSKLTGADKDVEKRLSRNVSNRYLRSIKIKTHTQQVYQNKCGTLSSKSCRNEHLFHSRDPSLFDLSTFLVRDQGTWFSDKQILHFPKYLDST
jgi:hypothetical protein